MKPGLSCSSCGGKTRVTNSRPDDGSILRRRECVVGCGGQRFATNERRDDAPIQRRPLPAERPSVTHKVTISDPQSGDHSVFVIVGLFPDGQPGELFLRLGKQGSTLRGFCDTVGLLTSYLLQRGVLVSELGQKLSDISFPPSGATSNVRIPTCSSLVDYVARWMAMEFPETATESAA